MNFMKQNHAMVKQWTFLVILAIILAGCSKLNKANYDKLNVGMGYEEVVKILGKPDSCADSLVAKSCIWGDDRKNITVNFIGDKVILYLSKNIK